MHSIIDHFIISQCLFDLIINYHSVCEDVDNMSDHSLVCLCLKIDSCKFECNAFKFKPHTNGNKKAKKKILKSKNLPKLCVIITLDNLVRGKDNTK